MNTFQMDRQFRNIISISIILILFLSIVLGESNNPDIYFFMAVTVIDIYYHWWNIIETVTITDTSITLAVRFLITKRAISIPLKNLTFSYLLGGGFRKSIMKLNIYYKENLWDLSISTGWSAKTTDAIYIAIKEKANHV